MKVEKKWAPILDTLNVEDKYRKTISEYAEHHGIVEDIFDKEQNYLPISIKLFSELKFDPSKITFTTKDLIDHHYESDITNKQIIEYNLALKTDNAIAFIQELETKLINKTKVNIQEKLDISESFEINLLIKKIFIDTNRNKIVCISNYKTNE